MSEHRYKTILMFGAPGSGKGTQGKMLASCPGFYHQSSGDIFRRLNKDSELGRTFLQYSTRGDLVPDDITIRVWQTNIEAHEALCDFQPAKDILLLDGIPRNPAQAKIMDEHIEVLLVLHLICQDEAVVIDRLRKRAMRENRPDDAKVEVIRRRLEVYHSETRPVLEHYPADRVREVDPIGTPLEVLSRVLEHVAPVQSMQFGNALA